MLCKYYPERRFWPVSGVVSMIDNRCHCGGLMDKLCGAISGFALAQAIHTNYYCKFNYPFRLEDYLSPASFDWRVSEGAVSSSRKNVCVKILWGEESPERLFRPDLWNDHQLHIYANRNYIEQINSYFGTSFQWNTLFKMLFKPGYDLQKQIDYHLEKIGGDYICCTCRFQSLLGDFKEYDFPTLPQAERESLTAIIINAIQQIRDKYGKKVLVTSDSGSFLKKVQEVEGIYTLPGKVVHLDCSPFENYEVYLKSFLDFYMISFATRVFCVGSGNMFTASSFPMYASLLNNVPFERMTV